MTSLDPRTPVLVGVSQLNDRGGEAEPVEFMTRAAEAALADSGADIAKRIQSVRVIKGIWRYRNPAALVADRLGIADATSGLTRMGGNGVYDLMNETAVEIRNGALDAALICSAEVLRTVRAKRGAGLDLVRLPEAPNAEPSTMFDKDRAISAPEEESAGLSVAVNFYAAAETALRHHLGEDPQSHLTRIAKLWATGSEVAALNPSAWITEPYDAAQVAAVNPKNRMVATPYPKMMTANLNVDQAAAAVICSAKTAQAAGISRDKWVFLWSGSGAHDHWSLHERWDFDASPAMRLSGNTALSLAGLSVDDVDLLDLYSCFPVVVQLAQRELGIDPDRPWTITGGLTFAGGPLNSYCLHALCRAAELLREGTGSTALITGNGGYFTKHAACVVASEPSKEPFAYERPQAEVDGLPARPVPGDSQVGTVEAYTVAYGRQAPDRAIVTVLDSEGGRHFTNSRDGAAMAALASGDYCGVEVRIDHSTEVPTVLF